MHTFLKTVACLSICLNSLKAESLSELRSAQQAKLEDAVQRLAEQRKDIQAQQLPLVQKLNTLEGQARQLRTELSEARKVRDSRSFDLETLKSTVNTQRKERDYIVHTLLSEYISNYESALSVGELDNFGASVRKLNLAIENPAIREQERLQESLELLEESLSRIQSVLGGKTYSGEALDSDGIVVKGTFVQVGPLLYFSDPSGEEAGVVKESDTLKARIVSIGKKSDSAIADFAAKKNGSLPMDVSLGDALVLRETHDPMLEHLRKGGIWVYPILVFALISSIIALLKLVQILAIRQPEPSVVYTIAKLLQENRQTEAMELARSQPQPARDLLEQAAVHSEEPIELIEEAMYESMLTTQPRLEEYLNVIAVTAAVAPLLGLLGTVTGIIKTFNLMQVFGAGDPKLLISGISEALITTELGLILAIPALIIHAFLSRKVAAIMAHLEKLSVTFINSFSSRSKR
jgi:biopolymer transport protein ExbB